MTHWLVSRIAIVAWLLPAAFLAVGRASAAPLPQPAWGQILEQTDGSSTILLEVRSWPADGKLPLPTPFPNITSAHLVAGHARTSLKWVFNTDASQLYLEVSSPAPGALPAMILLETAEKTAQFADGRIVFSALDA